MKKIRTAVFSCIFISLIFLLSVGCASKSIDDCVCAVNTDGRDCLGELMVLMYHNTLAPNKKESVYCINQNHLKKDFEYLKTHGYNVVSCDYVIKTVQAGKKLPSKAVILTFDDGYLNNIKYAQPLLEEYGYTGLFSVVGDYTRLDKTNNPRGGDFIYFGWQDIADANSSDNIEIGLHSYYLHNTKPRMGVSKLSGETSEAYKKILSDDTDKLVNELSKIGVTSNIYAYPYGKYCKESEEVMRSKGIVMTLTCNEGINRIYDESDLYLLKRYNRDATKDDLSCIGKM
ncbi:MAG: polysaccharide deacetylase family protein [Clostridia bacterium]|nr:polysaccharide deacetylase family protein [Clostridia bacterium]